VDRKADSPFTNGEPMIAIVKSDAVKYANGSVIVINANKCVCYWQITFNNGG
jgi:hypothetical protein